ncbi:hypothetical protein N8D56_05105 [Devosia sp. A8/3-2]|nr:hypothetical protein N8D56_05105 [Devosia sp. A8/3-2]
MNLNIGLSLTALAMAMSGSEPPPPSETRYVAPAVQGTGDGTSRANAAALASINTMIAEAGPGGTVAIASHLGDYAQTTPITLSAAGAAGNPVTITGMNAADEPTRPKFVGNRTAWVSPATEAGAVNAAAYGGNTLFAAAAGIGHLAFKFLRFERLGRIIDFSGITADGFLFEDCRGFNLHDGIYTNNLSAITNLVVQRCPATGFSKKFIRFHGACANWQVLDSHIDSRWQAGDNFAVGIECADTAHDLLIEGGSTVNCRDTLTSYFNGDGVVSERTNRGIHILNHASNGHTDAGYDLKSEDSSVTGCAARDNKRNFRIWGGLETPIPLVGCSSIAPHGRGGGSVHHLWVDGGDDAGSPGGRVAVDGLVASGGDEGMTAFYIDGFNSTIALTGLDITLSTGSVYKTSPATGSTITGLPVATRHQPSS